MGTMDKVIGYEKIKNDLKKIIDIVKNRSNYEKFGAVLPKGILLYGLPGRGKTTMAEALIEECGIKTFYVRKNKLNDSLIEDINNVFEEAKKYNESIIYFDDLDKYEDSENMKGVFAIIQSGIDSVKNNNVLVIATANDIDNFPDSLLRSGRFDKKIYVSTPNELDSKEIVMHYLESKKVNPNLDLNDVAKMINYSSCAELETLLNEACILAAYNKKEYMDIDEIVEAYLSSLSPDIEKEECLDEDEISAASIHEAGHLVVAETIHKGCVNFINIRPESEKFMVGSTHISDCLKRRIECILVGLAGKAACELFYLGRVASGCQSDLRKVTEYISQGMSQNGTNGIGFLNATETHFHKSELTVMNQEAVVRAEIEKHLFMVKQILIKNKDFLLNIADALKEKRYLVYSEIQKIRDNSNVVETVLPY